MQTNSVQHLENNIGTCISGKKHKLSQIVATLSWLVAHVDTLGAHAVHWNKCSLFEPRAALLQINMVRTTSWVPFHLASAQLNQPRFLSLSSYLLCSRPQTISGIFHYMSDGQATYVRHCWPLVALERSGWPVRERPSVCFRKSLPFWSMPDSDDT